MSDGRSVLLSAVLVVWPLWLGGGLCRAGRPGTVADSELQQAFDCLTRKEELFGLGETFISEGVVTYAAERSAAPSHGNSRTDVLVYAPDRTSAVLFELEIDNSRRCLTVTVVNFSSIERKHKKWFVVESEGGTPEYAEAQRVVDRLVTKPLSHMSAAEFRHTCATCKVN